MSEENEAVIRGLHEAIGNQDVDAVERYYSPDVVYHGIGDMADADFATFQPVFEAFPGFRVAQEEVLSDGDKVTYINIYSGTHTGDFMGIPATGKAFSIEKHRCCACVGRQDR